MRFDFKIRTNTYVIPICCALLTVAVYDWYAQIQPVYTYSLTDSRLDAHQYATQYDYFKGTTKNYAVRFPFNARILSSWLAAQLPFGSVVTNFKVLNGVFLVLMALFLGLLWQRLQIRKSLIVIGLLWLLFHWKGPVRMYLPDPLTADVGGYFFCALWLWVLSGDKPDKIFLCIIAILATLQKEVFIVVVGAWVVGRGSLVISHGSWVMGCHRLFKKNALIFIAIAVHFIADYFFPASNPDWRNFSIISVLRGVQRYVLSPELFLRLPVSWFLAFGCFQLSAYRVIHFVLPNYHLLVTKNNNSTPYIIHHISYITIIYFILSIFAGGDTSRILMTGAPFVMTFLLLQLNQMPVWVGYFVAVTSLPLMRLTQLEPDIGLHPAQAHDWCIECWPLAESWPYLVYMLAVGLVFWFLISKNLNLWWSSSGIVLNRQSQ